MATPTKLNARQQQFCELYLSGVPGPTAYRQAGFNVSTTFSARKGAVALLSNPLVRKYLDDAKASIKKTFEISRSELIKQMKKIAFGEIEEDHVVVVSKGDYKTVPEIVKCKPQLRDMQKALEYLLMFTEGDQQTANLPGSTPDDKIIKALANRPVAKTLDEVEREETNIDVSEAADNGKPGT